MSDQREETKDDPPQENQKKTKEDQKSRDDETYLIADMLLSLAAQEIGSSGKCDADGDSQENVGNKKENQRPRIDVEDFQSPLKKICRESSIASPKDSSPTDPIALILHSDAEGDSQENVESKKEKGKPNDVEDLETSFKKLCREPSITSVPQENQKPGNDNTTIVIKESVSTLKKQDPSRKEPEKDSYARRLLSDVETQIGFFKGVIDYNKVNKKYPFFHSKSIKKFTTDSLRAGASSPDVLKEVSKLKSQYSKSMKEFIRDWLEVDDSVEDVMEAVEILKLQYKERLMEIKGNIGCFDSVKDKAFGLAHMIWGSTEKPASEIYKTNDYHDGGGECWEKCRSEVNMVKKNPSGSVPFNYKISILRKIIDYKRYYKTYPFDDRVDLINFNKYWVQLDFSVETLLYSIVSFRKEYLEAGGRQVSSFESPEEELFYKLADQIWGRHK